MEQQVLEGGASLLAKYKPFLYVETDRTEKSRALIEWLFAAGYGLYWHLPRLFNPANFFGGKHALHTAWENTGLASPRDHVIRRQLARSKHHSVAQTLVAS
jgi:hypothetical protein